MFPRVYWIHAPKAGRLAIMPRPRAGDWLEDEIASWKEAGIDTVVSLLEREEIAELGLDRKPNCVALRTSSLSRSPSRIGVFQNVCATRWRFLGGYIRA
jgi:hypothetical protein